MAVFDFEREMDYASYESERRWADRYGELFDRLEALDVLTHDDYMKITLPQMEEIAKYLPQVA